MVISLGSYKGNFLYCFRSTDHRVQLPEAAHKFGDVAHQVRALGCQPRGRGFDPLHLRTKLNETYALPFNSQV